MRDVFQYLKFARTLREGAAADEAHKKGYTSDGSGYWLDRQGNRVAYTKNGKLVELTPRDKKALEAGQEPGQQPEGEEQQQEKDPMTFSNFNSQLNRLVPGGPSPESVNTANVEKVATMLSRGRWGVLDAKQRKEYMDKAAAMIAKSEADKVAAQQQPEPEPEPEVDPDQAEIQKLETDNRKLELQNQKRELEQRQKEIEGGGEQPEKVEAEGEPVEAEPKKEAPKKTLKDFKKEVPEKKKKEEPKKKLSLADRMAAGFDKNVAMDLKDEANIEIDHKDPDSIFVPKPVPQGELKAAAVSTSTPSPIPPQPGEGIEEYDSRMGDTYGENIKKQPLDVPKGMRRADYIFSGSNKTDLIGESAYMEAALKIFDGSYDADVLQMVGEKNLSPENKKKVDALLADISEAIPSKGLGKGWEESAARMVKLTTQHMDPNKKYKFGKSGDGAEGMRLTTVPSDMQDFTYDRANSLIQDKIGKTKLKELMGNDTAGIMDHYDPTDVVFFAEDAIEPFLARVEALGDEYDNGDPKTRDQDLLNGIRTLKQEFMADRSLLPISLKKPKKGSDPHFIPRNISEDYDTEAMGKVSFDLMTDGKDGMSWGFDGKRMGDLTDNFAMNFNMKDDVYSGNKFTMPVINHPGTGPHANNPFNRVANTKSEPALKGGAEAKLGMLDTKWIGNKKVNEILGYNFEEKYGNRDDNLGISAKNKAEKMTDEDRKILKNLVKEVAEHEGATKVNMKLPPGMDAEGFVDALLDADNLIHDELEGKVIKKGRRGEDAMDINLDPEQKKRVKEALGSVPDANFRSKVRTKFRQLRYAKLLQELEKAGKLGDFGKEYIYKNTMKIGNEYSPFILLG